MNPSPVVLTRTFRGLLALSALAAFHLPARAQIYIANGVIGEYSGSGAVINSALVPDGNEDVAVSGGDLYILDYEGRIGKYTLSGSPINSTLATASLGNFGFAVSGSDIFVANDVLNTVEEYTTSGATVTKTFASGLTGVLDIDANASDVFVANNGDISEYTTSGVLVNATLLTGIVGSEVVVSGSHLFVDNAGGIGEYTTSGATVNATLIPGPFDPGDLAVTGSDILVGNGTTGVISEYTLAGTLVNPALITVTPFQTGIAVVNTVPEGPWNSAPLLVAATLGLAWVGRKRIAA